MLFSPGHQLLKGLTGAVEAPVPMLRTERDRRVEEVVIIAFKAGVCQLTATEMLYTILEVMVKLVYSITCRPT